MKSPIEFAPERLSLASGARLLATATPGRKRAMLTLDYRTGSRFERSEDNGISHFLEHMLFRGTPRHPDSQSLAAAFEDLGGTLDASTAADRGNLSICLPRENLERALELVCEVYCEPLLADLEVERSIIFEEIQEDFDDKGNLIDGASAMRRLTFGDTGLGQLITGPAENLEGFDIERLRVHHQKTHTARSLVVSVAGDFVAADMLQRMEGLFGGVPAGDELPLLTPLQQDKARFAFVNHAGSSQTSVHLGFRAPGQHDRTDPVIEMLLRVVDDGMSTRLYQRLCDRSGLCYDASASLETYVDVGLLEFEATTSHQSCRRVVEELLDLCDELRGGALSSSEVERARRRVRWEYEALADSVVDVAEVFAHCEFSGMPTPERRLEQLLLVTPEEMREVADAVLAPAGRSLVLIGQLPTREAARVEELVLRRG